jgi:hypothetical protein
VRPGALHHEAAGTGAHRRDHRVVLVGHGHHQHPHLRRSGQDLPGRVDAGAVGQAQIHEDDVRSQLERRGQAAGHGRPVREGGAEHAEGGQVDAGEADGEARAGQRPADRQVEVVEPVPGHRDPDRDRHQRHGHGLGEHVDR